MADVYLAGRWDGEDLRRISYLGNCVMNQCQSLPRAMEWLKG
jgi:hypothetical protein